MAGHSDSSMISATETTLDSAVSAPNLFGTYLDI